MGAGDFVDAGFDAGFFASDAFDTGGFQTFFFEKAEIHSLEHAGPIHGFGAADAGGDAQDGVRVVKMTGEAKGFFEVFEFEFEGGDLGVDFVIQIFTIEIDEFCDVGNLVF